MLEGVPDLFVPQAGEPLAGEPLEPHAGDPLTGDPLGFIPYIPTAHSIFESESKNHGHHQSGNVASI